MAQKVMLTLKRTDDVGIFDSTESEADDIDDGERCDGDDSDDVDDSN